MALYVKDREVGELADRLAALRKTTKTEAVKAALRSALAEDPARPVMPQGEEELSPEVRDAMEFVTELHRKYPPGGKGLPATKEWIDGLYED